MLVGAVVLSFAAVLAATIGAGELLELAERPDGSTAFDRSVTSWFVDHRASWLTTVARALSTIGSQKVLIPLVAVVAIVVVARRALEPAVLLVVIWAGAIELYALAKHVVGRPRPPMHLWLTSASSTAFPSGHATQSLSTFAALALVAAVVVSTPRRPALAVAAVIAAGVGCSRVYLGVHWATDVLAGWLAAACWVALIAVLAHTRKS
ncbi:MAG TPA: phosphatase PAP2 family protein [Solirubrobacteraceae bacterium]|jgi:undecaprenyl-diphosphatase|nr:phosphatase PAP2 family protein [Solirubrobacteraceae bacterium]